ncbi:MAG: UDP-2,3-diacylglucosamine diphosphatase [Bdellovibrionales bacterium]
MGVKAYFISDLHLGSQDEPNCLLAIHFLKSFKKSTQISHLFLLGDIFDLWVADHKYFIKKFEPLIEELKRLHKLGVEIHYFEGNHDLYLEHYFKTQLGFYVHSGPQFFNLNVIGSKNKNIDIDAEAYESAVAYEDEVTFGKTDIGSAPFNSTVGVTVRVEHGDQMDPSDKGYMFLRWFLRTPVMKWIALHLPSWAVVKLGESMSHASRKYTSEVKTISENSAKNVIDQHAELVWRDKPYDIIISGHVHVIEDSRFTPFGEDRDVRVVNLGTWLTHPCAFLISDDFTGFIELQKKF